MRYISATIYHWATKAGTAICNLCEVVLDERILMPANLEFELATPQTEKQFRQLLRDNALAGDINLLLTKEPDAFHAAGISGDVYELILAYHQQPRKLVGCGARFELDVFVNGNVERIGYLGELRMQGGFKQRRMLLLEAYRAMYKHHEAGNAHYYITTIIADNVSTRRLLEAGLADMPTYQPLEAMVTLTIPARQAARFKAPRIRVESGSTTGIDGLAERLTTTGRNYQFHPVWSTETLASGQRCRGISSDDFFVARDQAGLRGALCLWDQRAFKQSVVAGYSRRLARARPFFNFVAPMLRQPRLPPPGRSLESAFLSHISVDPDDEATLLALIHEAAQHALSRGIDYIMLGLAERNGLCEVLKRRFSCHSYVSMIYLVYWQDGREYASKVDGRIPHPEMAIL